MLKKTVTYTDFMGNEKTRDFHFHLNKAELIDLGLEYKQGLADMIQFMIAAEDTRALMLEFQRLLLAAYGERSPDGEHFEKSAEISERFKTHVAYDQVVMDFLSSEDAIVAFIKGVMPADVTITAEDLKMKSKNVVDIPAPEQKGNLDLIPPAPLPKTPPPLPGR